MNERIKKGLRVAVGATLGIAVLAGVAEGWKENPTNSEITDQIFNDIGSKRFAVLGLLGYFALMDFRRKDNYPPIEPPIRSRNPQ